MRLLPILLSLFIGFSLTPGWGQVAVTPVDPKSTTSEKPIAAKPGVPQTRVISLVAEVQGKNYYLTEKIRFSLDKGSLLPPGGEFQVPENGRVIFRPMPGITAVVGEKTFLRLDTLDAVKSKGKIVERKCDTFLKEGSVFSALNKFNKQATTYRVQTPQAVAGAKGTLFLVTYRDGKGTVVVYSGTVQVTLKGKKGELLSGKSLFLKKNEAVDIEGEGGSATFSETRTATSAEIEFGKAMELLVSQYQNIDTTGSNPFFTASQAFGSAVLERVEVPGDVLPLLFPPNGANTSTNNTVSPTGP